MFVCIHICFSVLFLSLFVWCSFINFLFCVFELEENHYLNKAPKSPPRIPKKMKIGNWVMSHVRLFSLKKLPKLTRPSNKKIQQHKTQKIRLNALVWVLVRIDLRDKKYYQVVTTIPKPHCMFLNKN